MKVHTDFSSYINVNNPVVTVGTFDGVHLGHQKILNRIKKIAYQHGRRLWAQPIIRG